MTISLNLYFSQAEEVGTFCAGIHAWAILSRYVKLGAGDVVVQSNGKSALGQAITQGTK